MHPLSLHHQHHALLGAPNCLSSGLPSTASGYRPCPLRAAGQRRPLQQHQHQQHPWQPHQPAPARRLPPVAAKKDKDPKPKSKREDEKADFSAYWSLQFRNFFSDRREYLKQAQKSAAKEVDEPPEAVKPMIAALEQQERALKQKEQDIVAGREVGVVVRQLAREQAALRRRDKYADLEKRLYGSEGAPPEVVDVPSEDALMLQDVDRARASLRTNPFTIAAVTASRIRGVLQAVALLPFTLLRAAQTNWHAVFQEQRYQNFLMAEGERIWYWRNRSENERWFWEAYFWDRMAFPAVILFAYLYLVPNHLFWAVVVPVMGQLWSNMGVRLLQYAIIAYCGFYLKCWPDLAPMLAALGQW